MENCPNIKLYKRKNAVEKNFFSSTSLRTELKKKIV